MTEKIKLITDSTVDLSKELIDELDLEVIPLCVSYEGSDVVYQDGVDIHPIDIVNHVNETGKLPETSAIGPGVYEEVFNKWIDNDYSIIVTGIGSLLSANYKSIVIAKDSCKDPSKITVIDSQNLSSATGLLLLNIRDLLKKGKTREEVKEICDNDIVPNIRSSFCIDRTDYMVKGGRCSAMTGFFVKMLTIKPILNVIKGKLSLGKKPIGSLNNAIKTIYQDMMKEIANVDMNYLMITHCLSDDAEAYIEDMIRNTCKFKHIYNTYAGCVISSHCGPGTIGLLYVLKTNKK